MTTKGSESFNESLNEDDVDDVDAPAPRRSTGRGQTARGPRTGMKRSVMRVIRQIPAYLRLLTGLIRDRRVSRVDRLLVIGAIAYIVSPLDFIPDVIPFLGEVDDVYLLMLALQRMVDRAGLAVLRDHWHGDPAALEDVDLARVVSAAAFFLPLRLRRRLRRMVGR